jgi:GT2 family glycosyltransferase
VSAPAQARPADVDVIVVAHDSGELLERCVASAVEQVPADRVLVVDAASTDGSVEAALAVHPSVRSMAAENRGFAASNNLGIADTAGEFVLLLNPDAELRPGTLASLLKAAHDRPRAAIVGAKVFNPDGSLQANQAGRFPSLAQVVGLRLWRLWQRARGNRALSPRDFESTRERDWVTGACMLVRRAAIDEAGPMDEGFFLYYEDIEWCHRMRDHGWSVVQEPGAEVVHHLGGAGGGSAAGRRAYRESFYRYCDLYHLTGLRAAARLLIPAAAAPEASGR